MKNRLLKYLLILLIGAAAAASAYCAQLFLIIVIAAIGCIGAAWGLGYAAAAAGLSAAGIVAVTASDPIFCACTAGMVAFGSLTLAVGLQKRRSYRGILMLLGVIALLGIYLQTGLAYMLAGEPPYKGVVEMFHEMEQYYTSLGIDASSLGVAAASIPVGFYGYTVLMAELLAFVTLIVCKKLCTIFKCSVREMDKFMHWQLPRSLRFGIPLFAAGCFILYVTGYRGADTVLYTVLALLGPILFVQGLAFLVFIFTRGKSGVMNVLIYVMIAFLCLISPFSIAIVGAVDLFFGIRRRIRRYDDKMREAFRKAEENGSSTVVVDFDDGRGPQIVAVRKRKDGVFFDDDRVDDSAADPFGDRENGEESDEKPDGAENSDGETDARNAGEDDASEDRSSGQDADKEDK